MYARFTDQCLEFSRQSDILERTTHSRKYRRHYKGMTCIVWHETCGKECPQSTVVMSEN